MKAYRTGLKRTSTALMSIFVLGAILFSGTPALAQASDMQILLDRMERLERDIRTLNRQIARAPTVSGSPVVLKSGAAPAPTQKFTEGESGLSRVTVQLSSLEEEVRQATGLAEGMSYRIDQISTRLDKLITDLDYRLARLEGGAGGGSLSSFPPVSAAPSTLSVSKVGELSAPTTEQGTVDAQGTYIPSQDGTGTLGSISKNKLDQMMPDGASPALSGQMAAAPMPQAMPQTTAAQTLAPQAPASIPAPAPAPEPVVVSVLPEGTPRERYQFAFGLMSQARYDDAETALKEFIEKHNDDALASNARYWLGETYYVRKSFMDAAQTFFQAYKTAPEGAKAPDSLLKLGMSMANMEKVDEACTTYGKLRKEFIELKPSVKKNLNRETKRLKCQ